ncbi:hypothetical protein ACH4S9_36865 [Streptomyces sp. NPDC021225]|uniref:hypothetical protein n=1 Tax=Streptomyces sp. NPDC021225 TaxID=3365121 RepID=UPI0037AEAABA
MSVRDQVLATLNSGSREMFLVALGHRLGISARDVLTGDGERELREAQACNEMMIAIWSQLWATKDPGEGGYPDPDFLSALLRKADAGDARSHLRNAIESALRAVRDAGGNEPSSGRP